jgi:hypothetical protein
MKPVYMLAGVFWKIKVASLPAELQHGKEPCGQVVSGQFHFQYPAGVFSVRAHRQFTFQVPGDDVDQYVMKPDAPSFVVHDGVSYFDHASYFDLYPTLFQHFPARCLLKGFSQFHHAARDAPFTSAGFLPSQDQQDSVVPEHHYAHGRYGRERVFSVHGYILV